MNIHTLAAIAVLGGLLSMVTPAVFTEQSGTIEPVSKDRNARALVEVLITAASEKDHYRIQSAASRVGFCFEGRGPV